MQKLTFPVIKFLYNCAKASIKRKDKPLSRVLNDDEWEEIKNKCTEVGIDIKF